MNKIQAKDPCPVPLNRAFMAPNKRTRLFLRPRTDMSNRSPQVTSGGQQTSSNNDLDRILEYTQPPSLDQIKQYNKTDRYKADKSQFNFLNAMKTMKSDVKEID